MVTEVLNHPVKNLEAGLSEITSQNHGFSVNSEDVEKSSTGELTHINLNDDTVEGIQVKGKKTFSLYNITQKLHQGHVTLFTFSINMFHY